MGLPIVSTDFHSGAREILAPGLEKEKTPIETARNVDYGILVPACNGNIVQDNDNLDRAEKEMLYAISNLLNDKDLREHYCAKCKAHTDDLSVEKMVQKWMEIIGQEACS